MIRIGWVAAAVAAVAVVAAAMSTAPAAAADPLSDLMAMLPAGYSSDACHAIDRGPALAAVSCGANDTPDGPTAATYRLFGDDKSLAKAFSTVFTGDDWTAAECPGTTSPKPVALRRPDGTAIGSIVCARASTFQGDRDGAVGWARAADRFLGVAWVGYRGQAYPESLFKWVEAQAE